MNHNIPFSQNKLLHLLIVTFAIFWGILAISPIDRMQWLIENLLPVGTIIALALSYKKFAFSNLSYLYLLIFIFLCLHTYAGHYSYEKTPFDMWLKSSFHTQRSFYDCIVHFTFGLFWTYVFREILIRVAVQHRFWSYTIPVAIALSFSSTFEIIEMLAAILAGGQAAGEKYVGLQGDVFDTQKDMGLALIGGMISMGILAWIAWRKKSRVVTHERVI
ncbi:DUF2238 domain-containing protein [Paenibacillus sp. S3N08]|uniref:DUF2238 domain-containing protein n=2 Tax=Paenibacillus agricola TaxID=2716264 RepID=A0ABX0JJ19_9BACL|nr:DUF2238 domain-containing protein [Paenibacillus agricola]